MAHEMGGHYADKHPAGSRFDPNIAAEVKRNAENGHMSCGRAHRLANELGTAPLVIGFHLDMTETRITRCQLGLFGYAPRKKVVVPAETVSEDLEAVIRQGLVAGKLPCSTAWSIADGRGLKRMEVSAACERRGIKISPCQLGAFSGRSSRAA